MTVSNEMLAKAQAKREEHNRRKICIENDVCPDCGADMVDTWTEVRKGWFGKKQVVQVSGNEWDTFDYVKCLPCDAVYVQ